MDVSPQRCHSDVAQPTTRKPRKFNLGVFRRKIAALISQKLEFTHLMFLVQAQLAPRPKRSEEAKLKLEGNFLNGMNL